YGLDAAEFLEPASSFRTFNEFFFRRLRPDVRPVDSAAEAVVFPADGRHLGFESLSAAEAFFAKGQRFDLGAFVADAALARRYAGGAAVFSRLCPVDYHRFHYPVAGKVTGPQRIEGVLGSVNPIALRRRLAFLWENRRWLTEIQTERNGRVLMVEIGATNVGSVVYTGAPSGGGVMKGAEKGYFRFGGSAVMTLFEPGRVKLSEDLVAARAEGLELYAKVGERMGCWTA
ncbi:MAG: phosphatidylserine decarboxylase, partial [Verrucomicrobiales bacterium]|nr:phosphatidylserine decarboxylase [Verrucomicrobiales bacterium]